MNKYNIEVGDEIEILRKWPVSKIDSKGIYLDNKDGTPYSFYSWEYVNHELFLGINNGWALHKNTKSKGKIIGYTLLKDTPDLNKNTKLNYLPGNKEYKEGYYPNGVYSSVYYVKCYVEQGPEWFSPIYEEVKPTEVYVDTLAGKVKVTKEECYILPNRFESELVVKLYENIIQTKRYGQYNFNITQFTLGCKTFTLIDLENVYNAIKQVS